jgi:DNA polymerase III alpha subunit
MKYIDLREFVDLGYLQEVNRRFFHPLGLAMSVISKNGDDKVVFAGIIDSRDQEDGCIFDERVIDSKIENFEDKAMYVQGEWERKCEKRRQRLGYEIQPIKKLEEDQEQMSVDIQPKI